MSVPAPRLGPMADAPAPRAIFQKARQFFEPEGRYMQAKSAGVYPYFRPIEVAEGTRAVINGKEVIMAGSNNYLGLTNHPAVVEAAQAAIEKYGDVKVIAELEWIPRLGRASIEKAARRFDTRGRLKRYFEA